MKKLFIVGFITVLACISLLAGDDHCIHCSGKGLCFTCNGTGKYTQVGSTTEKTCCTCNGIGRCTVCNGTGKAKK